ncbi:MAG: MBL fold metallo-hydrolase, partial [Thermodesulfobacteriota bacterium]
VAGSVPVDMALADGQVIELEAGLAVRVLHTPGHSPGSVSFLLEEQGVLCCGDAVPVAGDLPIYDDAATSIASLRRLAGLAGVRHLLSAWAPPQAGTAVAAHLDAGLAVLARHHQVVSAIAAREGAQPALTLCRLAVAELGLPPVAVNPLVARSLASQVGLDAGLFAPLRHGPAWERGVRRALHPGHGIRP